MRKTLAAIIGLFCSPLLSQYVQIGEGDFLGTTAGPMVISTTAASHGCRFAYIFPASVLGNLKHADTIENMEFMRSSGAAIGTGTQFKIWLKNTTRSDFGAGKISFSAETSSATLVYNAVPAFDLGSNDGFYRFPFLLQKFMFDSTKGTNLVVLVEYTQSVVQPGLVNWYFEGATSVPGYMANQTKSFTGWPLADSLGTSSEYHPTVIFNYPRIDFDAAAIKLYTLGKLPVPLGNPDSVKLLVRNVGKKNLTGTKIRTYLKVTNNGLDSMLFSLGRGNQAFFNLPSLSPSKKGLDTVFAVTVDNNTVNNTARSYRLNNENIYSYRDVTQPPGPGGIGFNNATGDFVARFFSNNSKAINQITVAFAVAGRSFRLGIWDNSGRRGRPGKLLYQSNLLTTVAGNYILDLPTPVSVNGTFYVGVRQLGTANVAFGYQDENPVRPNTFFYATPTGDTNWVDFAPNAPFKFMIEPRLQGDTDMVAVSADFPSDSIDRYTMDTMAPRGTIGNIGARNLKDSFTVRCVIDYFGKIVYNESVKDTMSAGRRRTYTFPKKFYPLDFGEHRMRIIVSAKGDLIRDNDTVTRRFYVGVKKDVMVSSVFDPFRNAVYDYFKDTVMPTATIQNLGYDNTVSFVARCLIRKGTNIIYNRTVNLSLPKFQSRIVTWPTYRCLDTGKLSFTFTTEMPGDKFLPNDTQKLNVFVIKAYDLGIDSVLSPAKNVFYPVAKPILLRPRVYNDGVLGISDTRLTVRISSEYTPTVFHDTFVYPLGGKDGYAVSMPRAFTPQKRGIYRAVFKAYFAQDYVRANDSFVQDFFVGMPYDYGTVSVKYPTGKDTLLIGTGPFAPVMRIANLGFVKNADMVPFVCQVWFGGKRVYQDIKTTTLDTGQALDFNMFKTLNPINAGTYNVIAYTNYASDVNRKNDTALATFTVVVGKDAGVLSIDAPLTNQRVYARETFFEVHATLGSNAKQALGPVRTEVEVLGKNNNIVSQAFRLDTLQLAKIEKRVVLKDLTLPDSGVFTLRVRISSKDDQNPLNDTLISTIRGVRRHDVAWVAFEMPLQGQLLFNTTGNARLKAKLVQAGEDTTAYSGKAIFRVLDSSSGTAIFTDTGVFINLRKGTILTASSARVFPFVIAGSFRADAVLERFTDLFPENDTLRSHFRVVYNAVSTNPQIEFVMFPNPGNDRLMVSAKEPVKTMVLRDLSGKTIKMETGSGPYTMGSLAAGIYIVELQFASGKAKAVWVKRD
ncbi:MAG: T9SS type A sorting domain-containing protein [Sphingomonadales bacterium]|jgi:hypothetical protein